MSTDFKHILGLRLYSGDVEGLWDLVKRGGLIVVPSAPVLVDMQSNPALRESMENSDFAIADSGFLVLLMRLMDGQRLSRISGLRLLRCLLGQPEFCQPGATFWIMPSAQDAMANNDWLRARGLVLRPQDWTIAPIYPSGALEDFSILSLIEVTQPRFVMINLGGGVQERLGYFLRTHLRHRPAIICTGAAIAFLSGRQAGIPPWADRLFLGWLLRIFHSPARFIPRYWRALRLVSLLWHNRPRRK